MGRMAWGLALLVFGALFFLLGWGGSIDPIINNGDYISSVDEQVFLLVMSVIIFVIGLSLILDLPSLRVYRVPLSTKIKGIVRTLNVIIAWGILFQVGVLFLAGVLGTAYGWLRGEDAWQAIVRFYLALFMWPAIGVLIFSVIIDALKHWDHLSIRLFSDKGCPHWEPDD